MLNDILHRHFQVTLKFLNPSVDIHERCVAENKAQPSNIVICDTVKKNQLLSDNDSYTSGSVHGTQIKQEGNYNINLVPANTRKCIVRCYEEQDTVNPINNSDDIDCEGKAQLLNIKTGDSEEKNHLPNDNNSYILDQETVNPVNVSENTVDTVDNCDHVHIHSLINI